MNEIFRQGDSVRSDCGNARAGYHPEWSKERPWVTYVRGTAGQHFPTVRGALAHLEQKGYEFKNVVLKRELS